MKMIVGLGNPGAKYRNNRHNVGHMFIDYLQDRHPEFFSSTQNDKMIKTTVFMNQSGKEISKLVNYYKISLNYLIIVHDDLDIVLSKFKIEKGTGPKLHNGISSIEQALGKKDFWRLRIGVDNRDPSNRIDGETYVLQDFNLQERRLLPQIFEEVVDKWRNVFHNDFIQ